MLRKRIIPFLLSIFLLAGTFAVPASAEDLENASGSQTTTFDEKTTAWGSDYDTNSSFEINSVADLQAFATMVNEGKDFSGKTVTLKTDLDLSSIEKWIPIGSMNILDQSYDYNTSSVKPFSGTFDGGNHTISNVNIYYAVTTENPCYDYGGLFGYVDGTVKNVVVADLSLTASYQYFGGVAGYLASSGEISNCVVTGTISGENYTAGTYVDAWGSYVGGIVGYSEGTVTNCTSTCTIEKTIEYVGGIVGQCKSGTISGCTSNSTISDTITTYRLGGIVGEITNGSITDCVNTGNLGGYGTVGGIVGNAEDSTISDCSNSGTITGKENTANTTENRRVGGIVGDTQTTTIKSCTNTGTVTAEKLHDVGGVVGYLYYGSTIEDCSNVGDVTGGDSTGGVVGFASAYSTGGYEISNCTNSGSVAGASGVGGVVGVSTANDNGQSKQTISGCTNAAKVSGESDVGGIVGEHNSDEVITNSGTNTATVSGCINTGSVTATASGGAAGAIVGNNNDATKESGTSGTTNPGTVENNFWPAELGANAIGTGAGSSESETSEVVKNNSSYNSDGTLTTPITTGEGESQKNITTISEAVNELLGGGEDDKIPEVLKVTVTFDRNGHGTAPVAQEVVIGTKINLPSMDNYGYWTFLNWAANDTTYDAGAEYTVTADTTFVAQWRDDTPSTPVIPSDPSDNSDPTYSISLPSKVTGGEISLQKRYAEKSETVTITVTPDDGYELDELIVTDSKGNELDLTDKGNGKFTFKMPAGRVEIEVSFQEIVIEPVNPFVDVSTSDYYYDAVLWAVENGVTNGTSATTFGPNMAVSRAQMVTFLWRAHGSPKATGTNPFTDVSTSDYYYDAVLWAVANGVTNGTSATTFSPDTAVTRSQAVTFQWRAAGSPVVSGSSFGDVATDAYYVNAVTWAVANGITNGTGGNTFSPDVVVSRAQAVTFLWRELA